MEEEAQRAWIHNNPLEAIHSRKIEKYSGGSSIIDLSMINPDIPPPRVMLDRLVEATLKPSNHRYAVARGIRKLREAFAQKYANRFSVQLDPETEVCVTMGSKDAILQSLRLFAPVGSRVLLASPGYAAHVSACHLAGLEPVFFALSRDEDLMLQRIEEALLLHQPRILLLNFPNNPTGISVSPPFWSKLRSLLSKQRCLVINDFVYGELGHGGYSPGSLLETGGNSKSFDNALEVYSLSKAYSIPGWRIAAISGDPLFIRDLAKLKSKVDYGIFLPLQLAASFALSSTEDFSEGNRRAYTSRALCLAQGLRHLGFELSLPSAGACLWVRMPKELCNLAKNTTEDASQIFADRLLDHQGIHVLPGSVFGEEYSDFLRFALVRPEDDLQQVLDGIKKEMHV